MNFYPLYHSLMAHRGGVYSSKIKAVSTRSNTGVRAFILGEIRGLITTSQGIEEHIQEVKDIFMH